MKDLQEILGLLEQVQAGERPSVLATVVNVTGSAYRAPGTRMFVGPDGSAHGAISGGCLERDVLERSQRLLLTGGVELAEYDATSEEDALLGTGLGCQGRVEVLLERLEPRVGGQGLALLGTLAEVLGARQAAVLATVYRARGGAAPVPGSRLLLDQRGRLETTLAHSPLREALERDARALLGQLGDSRVLGLPGRSRDYVLPGVEAEVLLEPLLPPSALLVCGAGQDARPVCRLAAGLGWRVTVIDQRQGLALGARFPEAREVRCAHPDEVDWGALVDRRTSALVMTHSYRQDQELLRALLGTPFAYLGILGPKKRTRRLLEGLRQEGVEISEAARERIFSPVGLDLGAETPEEIALAILAELHAVLNGRPGGSLRERDRPIHERS